LMPMVLKMNIDLFGQNVSFGAPSTQWWSQLATAVAGGLTFSTVLTLVLTPCLLALTASKEEKVAQRRQHEGIEPLDSVSGYSSGNTG
jgi:multidrug efflux pump